MIKINYNLIEITICLLRKFNTKWFLAAICVCIYIYMDKVAVVASCRIVSCRVVSFRVVSCRVVSRRVASRRVVCFYVTSFFKKKTSLKIH